MRFASYSLHGREGLAVQTPEGWCGVFYGEQGLRTLEAVIPSGDAALKTLGVWLRGAGRALDEAEMVFLPPLRQPPKIICVGLNYRDHSAESDYEQPAYPTLFGRFATSLVGHGQPIVRPTVSEQLDYEGELAAVIGLGGRHIRVEDALKHVCGWSIFNEASIRDYQFKSPQWTMGKNFDGTGAFGPAFVTADELPEGARGLRLETRLNGTVVQSASTSDMVFDVATQIAVISEGVTLQPGDVIVTGTPAGVGLARKPPLWMKPGDVVEVEIEQIGVLRNPVIAEAGSAAASAAV